MRKLIMFNMVSLDGFFEGPNGEIDWHNVDVEFNDFAGEQLDSADLLLLGRVTYEMMASYWPTSSGLEDDPMIAGKMNKIPKIVFSRTLQKTAWNNTTLVKENIAKEISKQKDRPGSNMLLFGSANLASTLTASGLIDEYRIMVNPVVLGGGKPLFQGLNGKFGLKLLQTKAFHSGNVLLYYRPDIKAEKDRAH